MHELLYYTLLRFDDLEIAIAANNTIRVRASRGPGGTNLLEWTDSLREFVGSLGEATRLPEVGRYSVPLSCNAKWIEDAGPFPDEHRWRSIPYGVNLYPNDDQFVDILKHFGDLPTPFIGFGTEGRIGAVLVTACRKFNLVSLTGRQEVNSRIFRDDWIGDHQTVFEAIESAREESREGTWVITLPNGRTSVKNTVGPLLPPTESINSVNFRFTYKDLGSLKKEISDRID